MKDKKRGEAMLAVALVFAVFGAVGGGVARAGEANVVEAVATQDTYGTWRFDVTVAHGDTGWDHYADRWDVLAPDGKVLGSRILLHPHEAEQPFTRSLGGVAIAPEVREVTIRAHDSVHGHGGRTATIALPR